MPNQKTDEQIIAEILDDVRLGMEQRRIYKVFAHVSRSYNDDEGRDYDGMLAYVGDIFDRYKYIQIKRVPPRIVVRGDTAEVVDTFGTVAEPVNSSNDSPINLQGRVTIHLARVGGQWMIMAWSGAS